VSVVLLGWHHLPTWLELQVPWSSLQPYFKCVHAQPRTVALLPPCPPGQGWHLVRKIRHLLHLQFHSYSVFRMTSAARFRQKRCSMLPRTTSLEVVFLLHGLRGLATGSMHFLYRAQDWNWTTQRFASLLDFALAHQLYSLTCVSGSTATVEGHNYMSCRLGSGRHARHNQLNDLLCRAFISTGTLATRKSHTRCAPCGGKQPELTE
jgi:hypothetical protein